MRPYHFVLIVVIIATYLLVFDSALHMSRSSPKQESKPDTALTTPWSDGS
ncbi:MAG: hypothetical protein RL650_1224 [Pseudomonadota bacterium]|jgi:hypothetical protein